MTEKVLTPEEMAAEGVEIVKVALDDKGNVQYIGSLTADDIVEWSDVRQAGDREAKRDASAKLIVRSLVKGLEDPTRIGTEAMVPMFRKARNARIERLLGAILKLNGLSVKEETTVKNG